MCEIARNKTERLVVGTVTVTVGGCRQKTMPPVCHALSPLPPGRAFPFFKQSKSKPKQTESYKPSTSTFSHGRRRKHLSQPHVHGTRCITPPPPPRLGTLARRR